MSSVSICIDCLKPPPGWTPKAWATWCARLAFARVVSERARSLHYIYLNAGIPDSSSYYRKADETLGMTSKQFRHGLAKKSGVCVTRWPDL
ncbi:hypothetical protein LAD67_06480 [Escherichia coli]|nr:hypothetical protein [Escherichia coli]